MKAATPKKFRSFDRKENMRTLVKPVCFLDLDGVLVNFTHGVSQVHGRENPYDDRANWGEYSVEKLWQMAPEDFWSPLNNVEFWAGLEPTAECFDLIEYAEAAFGAKQVAILTSPSKDPASVAGKAMWIAKHLPAYSRRFFIGAAKELCAHPDAFLIDDSDYKIKRFNERRGVGILFPRPWNTRYMIDDPVRYVRVFIETYLQYESEMTGDHLERTKQNVERWTKGEYDELSKSD